MTDTLKYQDYIYNIACKFGASHEDALDAMQTTYIRIMRYYSSFRNDCNIKTWIGHIVRTVLVEQAKKAKVFRKYDTIYHNLHKQDIKSPAYDALELEELKDKVSEVLNSLPSKSKQIIECYMSNMCNVDIAANVNMSLPALKSKLHRIKVEIKEKLISQSSSLVVSE